MTRRTLAARHDAFALARPFRIARGVKTVADVVTVTLVEDGVTGRGEGVPYARYGETFKSALAAIEAVRAAIEFGIDRHALLAAMPAGAARNAVDCALWDIELRGALDRPASGSGRTAIASALTIGIDTPAAMVAATRAVAHAPLIKMKVDAEDPAARIRAVRAAAPDATLIVDPNESWNRAIIDTLGDVLIGARVALLEQPVPADDDAWLAGYHAPVPICADEAVHTANDLDRVAARYACVNIKLDKAGGRTAALMLYEQARQRGLTVMTGCMVSSSLSIAPAFGIAAMSDFADLDGPLWLASDYEGGVRDVDGMLSSPRAGFWG